MGQPRDRRMVLGIVDDSNTVGVAPDHKWITRPGPVKLRSRSSTRLDQPALLLSPG